MVLATSHPKNKKRFDKWLEAKTISIIFGPRVYLHRGSNFDSSSAAKQLTPSNIKSTIEFSYARSCQ
jgi:hypothetical protein